MKVVGMANQIYTRGTGVPESSLIGKLHRSLCKAQVSGLAFALFVAKCLDERGKVISKQR